MEFHQAAAAIVARGNVIVHCRNIHVHYNTPRKQTDQTENQNNKKKNETGTLYVKEEENNKEKEETTTDSQDICHNCKKPIIGLVISALDKKWHQEHWVCFHCEQQLYTSTSITYYEKDGNPYCKEHYGELFCSPCAACNEPIFNNSVIAMDKSWHKDHFVCTQCGTQLANFYNHDGKPYCKDDYFNMFGFKCGGCNKPIMGNYITALNKKWHRECFVCSECHVVLQDNPYFQHKNLPYCELHYHAIEGTICAGCHYPINGQYYIALSGKYHIEHFTCYICNKQLDNNTYKTQCDNLYCHRCFELRLSLSNIDNIWHQKHIVCIHCEKQLTLEELHIQEGKPYCRDDYIALFEKKCDSCEQTITGECVSALGRKWHPNCFTCLDQPYCESHYHMKTGRICAYCSLPIRHEHSTVESRSYHPEHFICIICSETLDNQPFRTQDDNLYCNACYTLLNST